MVLIDLLNTRFNLYLQFAKNAVPAKHSKVKHSKGRFACTAVVLGSKGASESPAALLKHSSLSPPPEFLVQWAWDFAFLTDSHMTLLQLVRGTHFENCRCTVTQREGEWFLDDS